MILWVSGNRWKVVPCELVPDEDALEDAEAVPDGVGGRGVRPGDHSLSISRLMLAMMVLRMSPMA